MSITSRIAADRTMTTAGTTPKNIPSIIIQHCAAHNLNVKLMNCKSINDYHLICCLTSDFRP